MLDTVKQGILNFENMLGLVDLLPNDEEIRSHWSRYMCIRAAGLLERSFINILTEYVGRHADHRVARRVTEGFERISNPNISVIRDVLGNFDDHWKTRINSDLRQQLRDSVDTIMANRNRIAHGRDVDITLTALSKQFRDVVVVIEFVQDLVLDGESV